MSRQPEVVVLGCFVTVLAEKLNKFMTSLLQQLCLLSSKAPLESRIS